MQKVFLLFLLFICFKFSTAQITPVTIKLDTAITKVQGSKSFYVRNPSNKPIQITGIRTLLSQFYFTTTPFSINPNDSVQVSILFKTNQNVTYRDFYIFETKGLKYPLVYYLAATAKYPDAQYSFTQGLYDEALKTALRSFTTTGYVSLGYDTGRDKMFETIDDYGGDTIECVYIGRKIRATNRTQAQNQNFNTEHTYPQSYFSENEPMKSDLFHLYPTDATPNSYRSNYAFGKVVSNITYQNGGSKLGKDSTGEIVFEPRDVHKGNVARSLFYFCVKYNNVSPGGFMNAKQENTLRQWNIFDTVDARENLRNTRIYSFQHVRNPFIDHPELVDRIKSTFSVANTAPKAEISAAPFSVKFDTVAANDTTSYYIAVMNYGNTSLTITSAVSSAPQFIVESVPSSVPAGELRYLKVKFKPTAMYQTYTGTLTIQNSDETIVVNLTGVGGTSIGVSKISSEVPSVFRLEQNYPNPFNPLTKIRFSVAKYGLITLKVFDVLGRETAMPVNEILQPGVYETPFSGSNLTSGIYYYQLAIDNEPIGIKRMVLVK